MSTTNPSFGVLLQLTPLPVTLLPQNSTIHTPNSRPDLPSRSSFAPSALALLTNLLTEAIPLLSAAAPPGGHSSAWKQHSKPRHFPNSTAPIHLSSHSLRGETWVCRRSVHRDAAERGSASWAEFETAFLRQHAWHEKEFTPTIVGAEDVAWWDEVKGARLDVGDGNWEGVSLVLHQMVHDLPRPMQRRSFPVLQGIAQRVSSSLAEGEGEFVVATIPVDVHWDTWPRMVTGRYAAVERFTRSNGSVEWVMATVSRAGGWLPGWVQDKAVPGVVAKDVDLYLKWVARERIRLERERKDGGEPVVDSEVVGVGNVDRMEARREE